MKKALALFMVASLLVYGTYTWAIGEGGIHPGVTVHELVNVLDNSTAPTTQQCKRPGTINLIRDNITVLLPAGESIGMSLCVKDNQGAAHDIIVDVPAGDNVVLTGVETASGVGITNASGSSLGDWVCLYVLELNKWHVMGKQGTWAGQ
jgi:hypothetical protein